VPQAELDIGSFGGVDGGELLPHDPGRAILIGRTLIYTSIDEARLVYYGVSAWFMVYEWLKLPPACTC
jgi:hypothetical protein